MRLLYGLLGICLAASAHAQLTITDNLSTAQVAQLLEGLNVSIVNVTIDCPGAAMGHFSGTSELDFTEGLVLSTGFVSALAAPASTFIGDATAAGSDPDLISVSGATINDACVLEFDCVPLGDTLLFNFNFGSEEYPEFVCSFNDGFGFFISGPGISGPYSNSAINIALIPGTGLPVTINNVHNGFNNDPINPNCPAQNPDYFVDNSNGAYVALDGLTVAMVAQAVVQEGQLYHIKLAVGDALDSTFDTALFFEALSFRSVGLSTGMRERLRFHAAWADGQLNLRMPVDAIGEELAVINADGRVLRRTRISSDRMTLELDELPVGVYTVHAPAMSTLRPARFVKE